MNHPPAVLFANRYTFLRELGQGGMATVYLAMDGKHHREVALKALRQDLAAAVGSERFLREIQITAGLNHPHILPLLDSGTSEGVIFYVMPFVAGGSLRKLLRAGTPIPLEIVLRIAQEVASALDYAHTQGVFHRDIKPENILFNEGLAVVSDFGIARAVSDAQRDGVTRTGLAVGTPGYMSPGSGPPASMRSRFASSWIELRKAALELTPRKLDPVPNSGGKWRQQKGPRWDRLVSEEVVAAEVPESAFPAMVGEIQRQLDLVGHASVIGGTLTWSPAVQTDSTRRIVISVTPRRGQTVIRVQRRAWRSRGSRK